MQHAGKLCGRVRTKVTMVSLVFKLQLCDSKNSPINNGPNYHDYHYRVLHMYA